MGRSVTCNFHVEIQNESGSYPMYGAMTLKDIKGKLLSEIEYQSQKGVNTDSYKAIAWPQTKTGERYLKGYDYLVMDRTGKVDLKSSYQD